MKNGENICRKIYDHILRLHHNLRLYCFARHGEMGSLAKCTSNPLIFHSRLFGRIQLERISERDQQQGSRRGRLQLFDSSEVKKKPWGLLSKWTTSVHKLDCFQNGQFQSISAVVYDVFFCPNQGHISKSDKNWRPSTGGIRVLSEWPRSQKSLAVT